MENTSPLPLPLSESNLPGGLLFNIIGTAFGVIVPVLSCVVFMICQRMCRRDDVPRAGLPNGSAHIIDLESDENWRNSSSHRNLQEEKLSMDIPVRKKNTSSGMLPICNREIYLISPGCPRPSVALQCRIVALNTINIAIGGWNTMTMDYVWKGNHGNLLQSFAEMKRILQCIYRNYCLAR